MPSGGAIFPFYGGQAGLGGFEYNLGHISCAPTGTDDIGRMQGMDQLALLG